MLQGVDENHFDAFVNLKRKAILLATLLLLRTLEKTGSTNHLFLALTATILSVHVKRIVNQACRKLILPSKDRNGDKIAYAGKTFELWANEWWIWAWSFNDTISPVRDLTGQYANQLQPDHVFFLAGSYGLTNVVRYVNIPANKLVFIPIFNYISFLTHLDGDDWYQILRNVAAKAGVADPTVLTEAELTSIYSLSYCHGRQDLNMTLQVDDCKLDPKQNGVIWTQPHNTFVLPINPDTGSLPGNHAAAQCGYYVMLAPLNDGAYHKIRFMAKAKADDPTSLMEYSNFDLEVTYHINFFKSFVSN